MNKQFFVYLDNGVAIEAANEQEAIANAVVKFKEIFNTPKELDFTVEQED